MPSSAAGIAREHLEAFLAAVSDRVSPATVANTTARCNSCSAG
jgi:hypothetical protein